MIEKNNKRIGVIEQKITYFSIKTIKEKNQDYRKMQNKFKKSPYTQILAKNWWKNIDKHSRENEDEAIKLSSKKRAFALTIVPV